MPAYHTPGVAVRCSTTARTARFGASPPTCLRPTPGTRPPCGRSTTSTRRSTGSRATAHGSACGRATPEQQALLSELFETEASRIVRRRDGVARARPRRPPVPLRVRCRRSSTRGPTPTASTSPTMSVHPERVEPIDDVLALHAAADVELRFTPRLGRADGSDPRLRPAFQLRPDPRRTPGLTGRTGRFTAATGGYVRRTMSAVAELLSHTCDTDRGIQRVSVAARASRTSITTEQRSATPRR